MPLSIVLSIISLTNWRLSSESAWVTFFHPVGFDDGMTIVAHIQSSITMLKRKVKSILFSSTLAACVVKPILDVLAKSLSIDSC